MYQLYKLVDSLWHCHTCIYHALIMSNITVPFLSHLFTSTSLVVLPLIYYCVFSAPTCSLSEFLHVRDLTDITSDSETEVSLLLVGGVSGSCRPLHWRKPVLLTAIQGRECLLLSAPRVTSGKAGIFSTAIKGRVAALNSRLCPPVLQQTLEAHCQYLLLSRKKRI